MQESLCTEAQRTLPGLRLLAVVAVQESTPDARSPVWLPRPLLVFLAIRDIHTRLCQGGKDARRGHAQVASLAPDALAVEPGPMGKA